MTNAEREQLRELADWLNEESRKAAMNARLRIEDSITAILEAHSAKLAQWVTALDSAEKREKEHKEMFWPPADQTETHLYEIRTGKTKDYVLEHVAALLSTERERVIEECAKVAESYRSITPANEVIAAELRALRSPEVAPEERK